MRGILVYARDNVPRNRAFVEFFQAAARKRGVTLDLVLLEDLGWGVRDGKGFLSCGLPDFAVMRCMAPLVSRHLEQCGAAVFNNARTAEICNDKRRTHLFFQENGFPCLDTAFVSADCPCHPFAYPVVVKASGGCGGRQVFLCPDEGAYREKLRVIAPDTAVVQPLCDTPGRDIRAYVLDGRIIQAMERYSDADFRSNFGLHGQARPVTLSPWQRETAERAVSLLGATLVGVDFIFHRGKCYCNEIEDAVGTRMLYQYTDIQIVEDYMDVILKKMKNR